jgi:cytochrome c oxidase cbb3-type subunit III
VRVTAFAIFMAVVASAFAQPQPAVSGIPVEQGNALYDQHCTACHGASGGAGERAPAIVAADSAVLRGERSEAPIVAVIHNGIPGTAMPAFSGQMSDDDIGKIGAYIHALRGTALDNPLPGDVKHGEEIFWSKGQCGGCHALAGRGNPAGPDLTDIAALRKSTAIVDALTKVEHRLYGDGGAFHLPLIPPMDYSPVHVVTKDGRVLDGLMRNQDAWSVQFVTMDGKLHSFERSGVRSVTIKPTSIMPTDYDKRLSPSEFRDLTAFLTRQGAKMATPGSGE